MLPLILASSSIIVDNSIIGYHYRTTQGSLSRRYDESFFNRAEHLIDGLTAQLQSSPEMLSGLNYYLLFILEVGFGQLISRISGKNLFQMNAVVRQIIKQFSLPTRLSAINLSLLPVDGQKRVQALLKEKSFTYIFLRIRESVFRCG